MKAIINGDRVVGLFEGDGPADAVSVPEDLRGVPLERLRYAGKRLVDAATLSQFWVGSDGYLHASKGAGRKALRCKWNDQLTRVGDRWEVRDPLRAAIKRECARRIVAVLKDNATQANLQAYASELLARRLLDKDKLSASDAADLETARAAWAWVGAMQERCRELVAASEADYAADERWPAPPDGTAALVARL